nr:ATP-dependent DNA ligase [Flavihumibacter rivuli]
MEMFAELVQIIGHSTKTSEKLHALVQYFQTAPGHDKIWVIALFSGRRPKRSVNSKLLREWCCECCAIPEWLFEESYHTVGDLAETIALLLPPPSRQEINHSLHHYLSCLTEIASLDAEGKKAFILAAWEELSQPGRFVFNKLITGGFRIGLSQQLMVQALAKVNGLETSKVAHLITGQWDPLTISYEDLFNETLHQKDHSKPYPFYLAYTIEDSIHQLGEPTEWQAEWKWDGIRGQLIKRNDQLFVWSRGEELMTEKFPEYHELMELLPNGTVLDGEIMPYKSGSPLPFSVLQTRIGRKQVTRKQLQEAPVAFFAYDLLEWEGNDWRDLDLAQRRNKLETLVGAMASDRLRLSPVVPFDTWEELITIRQGSRDMGAEGLMLKRKSSGYLSGRKKGDWWKWKIDPLTIDAVMVYAQKGHGRRSNLYTDYTFAVRDGDRLVTFTKAYSGLTDKEILEVDAFVKKHAIEKFGPVRTVQPELVFEIAFEGIAASNRHKSGVALRFPRINRWRKDKPVSEINTLDDLLSLLNQFEKKGA